MKKLSILFLMCFALTVAVNAQEFKKFRVGVGGGYAIPGGNGAKAGVLFYLEPSYRIQDQLSVGLRMEWAAMARGFSEDVGDAEFDVSTSGSYTVNGQYYFNNNSFRPFVGVGLGMYSIKAASWDSGDGGGDGSDLGLSDETKFGFYPRAGFDAGHFTFSLDYNIVPATKFDAVVDVDENFNPVTEEVKFKNSYFGIRVGVSIGGGRK